VLVGLELEVANLVAAALLAIIDVRILRLSLFGTGSRRQMSDCNKISAVCVGTYLDWDRWCLRDVIWVRHAQQHINSKILVAPNRFQHRLTTKILVHTSS
jgi:hypothetical protein